MFRIKTDIRQYRCKNREKVERLIRNWVIRPSDLIFDGDSREWRPIGDDPLFLDLFATLEEAHHNQPDTVITARSPLTADDDLDGKEDAQEQERPIQSLREPMQNGQTPGFGILRRPSRRPPEPSPDVEGVSRDSDEITIMTGKTFERLQEEAETAPPDEVTEISARPTFDDEEVAPDEVTHVIDRAAIGTESKQTETNQEPKVVISDQADEAPLSAQKLVIGPGTGRHNLPEDVFATAEIPETRREDVFADSSTGNDEDGPSRWNIVLDEMPEYGNVDPIGDTGDIERTELFTREAANEASEPLAEDSEDLRATVDLDAQDIAVAPQPDEDEEGEKEGEGLDADLRDTLDLAEEEARDVPEDDTEQLVIAEAVGDGFDVDVEALDEAMEELEFVAIEARANEEDLPELDVSAIDPMQRVYAVSAGYTIEYPIEIAPSEEALEAGLIRSELPEPKRDRYLNQPTPKTIGTIVTHTFDLQWRTNRPEPVPERFSLPLIALAGVGALVVIALLLWAL